MRESFMLTVFLYEDSPFHLLDAIFHAQELLKVEMKRNNLKCTSQSVYEFCVDAKITGISEIKNIRDMYVHDVTNYEGLRFTLLQVSADNILSILEHFNVKCCIYEIEADLDKVINLLDYLIAQEER